ncbi:MAG: DegV family protein [Acholeplasmatales bacterium]|jgi:DegV family protein with EDD domain|nr:DegV family protein [Acholeplasmatales bacterium]
MKKTKIICDSTCDLLNVRNINEKNFLDLLVKRDVDFVALSVVINGIPYQDAKDITVEGLFQTIKETKGKPSTTAVSPGMFLEIFNKYLQEGYEVLYISISSEISGTYNSSLLAREALDDLKSMVHIVDGRNLSTGTGLLVLKACDLRDLGYSAQAIKEQIDQIKNNVRCQFGISTLEYLYRGGRASGLTFFVSKFLRIKPILLVKSGHIIAGDKIIGKTEKTILRQFEYFLKDYQNGLVDPEYVFFTHCLAPDLFKYVEELFKKHEIKINHIYETWAGSVISTHCGPGTLGIIYCLK